MATPLPCSPQRRVAFDAARLAPGLRARRRLRGFTLIDVLVLIVLLGLVAGSLTVLFSRLASQSAQSLREREAQRLAHALLHEVAAMPFTFCDAQDPRARLATSASLGGAGCSSTVDGMGPEPGESRAAGSLSRFDHVSDYANLAMPGPACAGGICDAGGNLLNPAGSPLAGCSARFDVSTAVALPGIATLDANGRAQVLHLRARVACPGQGEAVAETVRVRHAPRAI